MTVRKIEAVLALVPNAEVSVHADDVVTWYKPKVAPVTEEQIQAKLAELIAAYPLQDLREQRNRILASTDWWASSDLVMSDERKACRQALRDRPSGLDTEE